METDVLPTFGMSIEGDIVVRTRETPDLSFDAPLADPNRLWPGGVVHYKFYTTFPRCSHNIGKPKLSFSGETVN